jgi:hypothetical protein
MAITRSRRPSDREATTFGEAASLACGGFASQQTRRPLFLDYATAARTAEAQIARAASQAGWSRSRDGYIAAVLDSYETKTPRASESPLLDAVDTREDLSEWHCGLGAPRDPVFYGNQESSRFPVDEVEPTCQLRRADGVPSHGGRTEDLRPRSGSPVCNLFLKADRNGHPP